MRSVGNQHGPFLSNTASSALLLKPQVSMRNLSDLAVRPGQDDQRVVVIESVVRPAMLLKTICRGAIAQPPSNGRLNAKSVCGRPEANFARQVPSTQQTDALF